MNEPTSGHAAPTSGQAVERELITAQLSNAVQSRSSQDGVVWTIFGIFWAAHAVLLVALVDGHRLVGASVGIPVSLIAVLLSVVWLKIQQRALQHIDRHEALIEALERKLGFESWPELALNKAINRASYDRFVGSGIPARVVMRRCVQVLLAAWLMGLITFVVQITA